MTFVGVALVLAGGAGTVWGVTAAASRPRPLDVVAALVAPIALVVAMVGGVLIFVPGFFAAR
ncbi:MAG TPA: hypothetical protein VMZ28_16955 [Kofleriaceae bacterium]|nr:hypothetical protein [Kofleriaceae bacterium]